MSDSTRLIPSGISLVDRAWGGFYEGGSYLIVGPRKSGRTSLALQFACEAASRKEACLYFTTMRPRYLSIQAASIGIHLERLLAEKSMAMMRILSPASAPARDNFAEYIDAVQESIQAHRPDRVVIDELTPLVGPGDQGDPAPALASLTERLESNGITSLYVIGEPATPSSRKLADSFVESMTGTICLQRDSASSARELPGGRILITPNIGHPEGQFMAGFSIEPHKQLQMDDRSTWSRPSVSTSSLLPSGTDPTFNHPFGRDSRLDHDFLPAAGTFVERQIIRAGLCSAGEFLEELHAHLETSRSTGALPRVVAFRVEPSNGRSDSFTLEQIARTVEAVGGPGHKVCVHRNLVMTVDPGDEPRDIHALVAEHIEEAMHRISGMLIHVNQRFPDAESFFAYVERKFSTEELPS
jgi:KaiC/GvpD/RAD55 family RecA-like ATPase